MKRLMSAVLALSLLGATAASAQPYRHGGYSHSYSHSYNRGWNRHNDTGALIGLGIGLFALGAIAAAASHDRDRYNDRYEYVPPPPPPPAYRGYNRGYGY